MTKKPEAPPAQRPFFKCFPSNFLMGCLKLSPEQKAIYYTLTMALYDTWAPIDDSTVKNRQDLARFCGVSTRTFTRVRDELLAMPEKLFRPAPGRLSNRRFERELLALGSNSSQIDGEKKPSISNLNGQLNEPATNENNGLGVSRTRASPESRLQTVQNRAEDGQQVEAEKVVESEIAQVCRALGVNLQSSTHRHGWAHRWARMRVELDLTVGDMVAAIDTYRGQINFEEVRSLGLFKDRAIEKRVARTLNARIAARTTVAVAGAQAEVTRDQWAERARLFLAYGAWIHDYGPSPLEPGCLMPTDLLDKAEPYWVEQGNHAKWMSTTNGKEPWKPGAGMTPQVAPFAPRSKP